MYTYIYIYIHLKYWEFYCLEKSLAEATTSDKGKLGSKYLRGRQGCNLQKSIHKEDCGLK